MKTQNLKGKKLLLMSGSKDACEIVKIAHDLGILVYATDWYQDSPVKRIADKSFMVSTADVDAIVELCQQEGIDGIFSGYTDSVLPYCQEACARLGLPFWGNKENIEMCIDKNLFKVACEQSSLPVVPYVKMNQSNYLELIQTLTAPVVFKPVDNSGSRGVYKCYKDSDLKEYCEKALSYSKSKEILAEKLMDANCEYSVYYILDKGKAYLTAMGDRYVYEIDNNIAPVGLGMRFPSTRLSQWIKEIDPLMMNFFKKNQMKNGFVFVQGFYMDKQFYIHEIGYRLNGGFTYKLVEHFSGYNQVEQLLRFALTGEMNTDDVKKSNPFFNGIGMIVTTTLKNGIIGSIQGVEEIRRYPGVLDLFQLKEIGNELSTPGTTAQVFSYSLCATDTLNDMRNLIKTMKSTFVIKDISGEDMILPMIDENNIN